LARAYRYPIQLNQLNDAIKYLSEHSSEHGA
jgi:uncharacterized protein (DUF433 family)